MNITKYQDDKEVMDVFMKISTARRALGAAAARSLPSSSSPAQEACRRLASARRERCRCVTKYGARRPRYENIQDADV